jgi:hypothetical protein
MYSAKLLLTELTDDHSHLSDLNNMILRHDDDDLDDHVKPKSHRERVRTETLRSDITQVMRKNTPEFVERKKKGNRVYDDSYEVIANDQNTERKPLQNVNLAATPESVASLPIDNKEAVFNAYKTIEKLQDQLMLVKC